MFQRRFDPTHRAVKHAVQNGEVGEIEDITIISRDPGPPPSSYVAVSGGQFHDQMIHDFDMALWLSGTSGRIELFAMASNLVDPEIGKLGDTDTAEVLLRFETGALCRAKFGLTQDEAGREVLDLLAIIRVRIELPDVRELIRAQDRLDKPALIVVDGVGIGLGVVQDLKDDMPHVVPGGSLEAQNVKAIKIRRFHTAMIVVYDGLVRLPATMPGLEILLPEFSAFPDGRHDDQADAVCYIAANYRQAIRQGRRLGENYGRLRRILRTPMPEPPKSRDQQLYERRRYFDR
jgi:hypothetical protein